MAEDDNKSKDERMDINHLTKKMLAGENKEVMDYLRSLPKEECDEIRGQLIKSLEAIQKKRQQKPPSSTAGGRRVAKKDTKTRTVETKPTREGKKSSSSSGPSGSTSKVPPGGESLRKRTLVPMATDGSRLVGNYRLLEEVGKGMYGTVHRAFNTTNNQTVAVKEIDLQLIEAGKLEGVMKEAQLLSKLDNTNIVRIFDSLRDQNKIYFVLEFIDCGSIAKILRTIGIFPVPVISSLIKQTLEGLTYLHGQNVIHRDIKSDNLLINSDGVVKLADFGTAKEDVGKTLTVIGTPFWMAPEIIEVHGARLTSDIWSLGCTVLEMLTGHPPYFEKTPMQALFSIVDDPHPPCPTDLPPELNNFLLDCCFIKNPEKRPSSKTLLDHIWITMHDRPVYTFEHIKSEISAYHTKSKTSSKLKTRSVSNERDKPPSSRKEGSRGRKRSAEDLATLIKVVAEERDALAAENAVLKQKISELRQAK